jgi:hypothetical protein
MKDLDLLQQEVRRLRERMENMLSRAGGYISGPLSYAGNLRPVRTSGTYTGYVYVPLDTPATIWSNQPNVAPQTINLQVHGLPDEIVAVNARMSYKTATNGDNGSLSKGVAGSEMVARVPDANEWGDETAIVRCDGNGDIYFNTNNSTNFLYLFILGYFI